MHNAVRSLHRLGIGDGVLDYKRYVRGLGSSRKKIEKINSVTKEANRSDNVMIRGSAIGVGINYYLVRSLD